MQATMEFMERNAKHAFIVATNEMPNDPVG